MGNPQYIQDAVDGFESLYGEELTGQQRANLVEACEYGGISLRTRLWYGAITPEIWRVR